MTVAEWLAGAESQLSELPVDNPRFEAQLLAAHALGQSRSWLLAHLDAEIPELAAAALLQRRLNREPIAYLRGEQEFFGRAFCVRPGVLIPRQDTEILVEAVLKEARRTQATTCLDVGTGSGCVAITLALESQLEVTAVDVSMRALDVAALNAHRLNANVELLLSDRFEAVAGRQFDLIASNPPYIRIGEPLAPEIDAYEPHVALYAGNDGLDAYRWLSRESGAHLTAHGSLWIEIGQGMGPDVVALFASDGWRLVASLNDLAGIERTLGFARAV